MTKGGSVRKRDGVDLNGESKNNKSSKSMPPSSVALHKERANIVLWKSPLTTIYYFFLELIYFFTDYGFR